MARPRTKPGAWLASAALSVVAACAGGEPDPRTAVDEFEQKLVIDVDGASLSIPLEAMDVWLTDDPSRPERFEIHGNGVAIVGIFPRDVRVDYAENWHVLIGRSIPLSDRGGDPHYEKPSILTVSGIGQFRVVGGSFTVDAVVPGRNGQTPLTGRIELRVRAATGEASLTGTFAVKAMTWG